MVNCSATTITVVWNSVPAKRLPKHVANCIPGVTENISVHKTVSKCSSRCGTFAAAWANLCRKNALNTCDNNIRDKICINTNEQ